MTDFISAGPDESMPPLIETEENDGIEVREKPARDRPRKATTAKAKPNVNVTINSRTTASKTRNPISVPSEADKEVVKQLAANAGKFVVMGLAMGGGKLTIDAGYVQAGLAPWSEAVAGLAPYEPWLVKIAKGGDTGGRISAWAMVGIATLGLAAPILLNHNALPPAIADIVQRSMEMAQADAAN